MHGLKRISFLFKKYNYIFDDVIKDSSFVETNDKELIFKDKLGNITIVSFSKNSILIKTKKSNIDKVIFVNLPNTYSKEKDITVNEISKENRPKGCIIETIDKVYSYFYDDRNRVLSSLKSRRYAFDKEFEIDENVDINKLKDSTKFIKTNLNILLNNNTYGTYQAKVLLNDNDISYIYDLITGDNKIERIYSLYNGTVNEKKLRDIFAIRMDVLSFNALGYKELIGIDKVEDLMAGPSIDNTFYYKNIKNFDIVKDRIEDIKEEDFNNLESFLNTITIKNNNKQMVLSK